MKNIYYSGAVLVLLIATAFTIANVSTWRISDDYVVKFSGKYADGTFKTLKGTVIFDEENVGAARFDVNIPVASINTGNFLKNRHAKSEKWFDEKKYPVIHFVATSVVKTSIGYEAHGQLEMHGIKKEFTIPFTFIKNKGKGVFTGIFKVNRADFAIGETKGDASDLTTLEVRVPVTQQK